MTTRARIALLFSLALPLLNSCQLYDQMVVDIHFPAKSVFREHSEEQKADSTAAEAATEQAPSHTRRSYRRSRAATSSATAIISDGSNPSPQLPSDMRHPTTPGINTPEEEASSTESAPAAKPNDAELRGLRSPEMDSKLPANIKQ